ncbi:MAG TPA: peptidoglycan editing factor PgeF [Xanthomonadaceae bacterium]|nr:peptidoglycan editing factor PgeF [Xanthomonadaceae bacterium]
MTTAALLADWPAPPGVVAFTTLRHGAGVSRPPFDDFNLGARCGDDADVVAANRRELAERFGLPAAPVWLRQVHGTAVLRVPSSGPSGHLLPQAGEGIEPEADAAVTDAEGVVLAILTADCLPVVFASDDGGEIGAAHAGWRGLAAGVLEATVAAMRTPPARLLAWLGPAAGPADYEVGAEVRDAFVGAGTPAKGLAAVAASTTAEAFVATRPGHWRVDLYALARLRLQRAGLPASAIHGGGLSTIAEPGRFFSHRRDQRTGRMATLAWRQARASASR